MRCLLTISLITVAASAAPGDDVVPLEAFDTPDSVPRAVCHNPVGEIWRGAPRWVDGALVVTASTDEPQVQHGLLVIPVPAGDADGFRYIRLRMRGPVGLFYRLAVMSEGAGDPAFDDFAFAASNAHYSGPWGTRQILDTDDWTWIELDLDHTVPPFPRADTRVGAVCIEVLGPRHPLSHWGGARGMFDIAVDAVALAAVSLVPEANLAASVPTGPLPLLVGCEAHGAETIRVVSELELGNFTWIPSDNYHMGATPFDHRHTVLDDVRACVAHERYFWVSGRRGLGDRFRPGGPEWGGHGSGEWYLPSDYALFSALGGRRFVGAMAEELDADLLQENWRPMFRARMPELLSYTDRAGGRAAFEGELRRIGERYHGYGVRYLPSLCITHQHSGFRAGGDAVIAEVFEHLPTTELQYAYLRGGSRQFGAPWGVWFSAWYKGLIPSADERLWPSSNARAGGGHSASMFRRALWLAYASGARILVPQNTELLYARGGDGSYRAASWGAELQRFWAYARDHAEPIEPVPRVAVLIDADNGWEPPYLWGMWRPFESVWGILPPDRFADGMFREYLNALLPGFLRSAEAVAVERADVYPGYFAATPLGPFDIVASDIEPDKLAAYPTVVLLGDVGMSAALRYRLEAYVRGGGVLVLNVTQLMDQARLVEHEALVGARVTPTAAVSNVIVSAAEIPGVVEETYQGPSWYSCAVVRPTDAETLAFAGAPDAAPPPSPVLLRHRLGSGAVYLSTPHYMLAGLNEKIEAMPFFVDLIAALAAEGEVELQCERPVVSWIASRQGADLLIGAANHDAESVGCVLRLRSEGGGHPAVEFGETLVESALDAGPTSWRFVLTAEDVALIRVPGAPVG